MRATRPLQTPRRSAPTLAPRGRASSGPGYIVRRLAALGALAALLFGAAAASAAAEALLLDVGGLQRSVLLHRPSGLGLQHAVPLVVMLHGGLGSAAQAEATYRWDELADREGFVVAYPDGIGRTWNSGGFCCGRARREAVDDLGFIAALIESLVRSERIDPQRVYLAGMSNGAAMAYRYACEGRVAVAAIGAVAGSLSDAHCAPPEPVSVLAIHGLADENVPFAGGFGPRGLIHGDWVGVTQTLEHLRAAAHCASPVVVDEPPLRRSRADCEAGREVELITVDGAGHQWPGALERGGAASGPLRRLLAPDPPSRALDATAELWAFFRSHPRPAQPGR